MEPVCATAQEAQQELERRSVLIEQLQSEVQWYKCARLTPHSTSISGTWSQQNPKTLTPRSRRRLMAQLEP